NSEPIALTRTSRSGPLATAAAKTSRTSPRAPAFSLGTTASSRSATTASAAEASVLWSLRSSLPGGEYRERRRERGGDVAQVGDRAMQSMMGTCVRCPFFPTGGESLCLIAGFISFVTSGGYAERLACSTRRLLRIPDEVSDEAAAALQIAFGTAWHMLFTRG